MQNYGINLADDDVSMDVYIKKFYDFEQKSLNEHDLSIHQQNIYTNSLMDESTDSK